MAINIVERNNASNSFDKKAKVLGMCIEKQVETLNKMYLNKLEFRITDDNKIAFRLIDNSINVVELPEVESFDTESLIDYAGHGWYDKLSTVKMPKCTKYIELIRASWLTYIDRLFIWDTTELDMHDIENARFLSGKTIIVRSTNNNNKPLIYRF